MAELLKREKEHVHALTLLTLNPANASEAVRHVAGLNEQERAEFVSLADSHHVVIRAMNAIVAGATAVNNMDLATWAQGVIASEHARIDNALSYLDKICRELEEGGCPTTVMKSLDHWPDLGNDLDLYSTGADEQVIRIMKQKFNANVEPQSWGDKLAHKWNFTVPGLPEAVEVHVRRLGQMGEHTALARRFVSRRQPAQISGYTFPVPAPEERVIVATLQRMYRHFYARVCDIANISRLVESGAVDFVELRKTCERAGIWAGVSTFLVIVSDYVKEYRGTGLNLPQEVRNAARFGKDKTYVRARFIRVPIMPEGAKLYTEQVTRTAFNGDVPGTFRLSLLPPLASVAAVAYKLTGSDKGIW